MTSGAPPGHDFPEAPVLDQGDIDARRPEKAGARRSSPAKFTATCMAMEGGQPTQTFRVRAILMATRTSTDPGPLDRIPGRKCDWPRMRDTDPARGRGLPDPIQTGTPLCPAPWARARLALPTSYVLSSKPLLTYAFRWIR